MPDRRRYERVALSRPIYVEIADCEVRQTRAVDISYGGISILCDQPLSIGLNVTLRFSVGVQTLHRELVVRARVCHVHIRDNHFVMGLEFTETGVREQERIRELVDFKLRLRVAQGLA